MFREKENYMQIQHFVFYYGGVLTEELADTEAHARAIVNHNIDVVPGIYGNPPYIMQAYMAYAKCNPIPCKSPMLCASVEKRMRERFATDYPD
jgi:hypothetical protein